MRTGLQQALLQAWTGRSALAWVLREANVASAIIGASRPEQVSDNAKASGLTIDPALFARAEAIVEGAGKA